VSAAILPPDTDVSAPEYVQLESGLIVPGWLAEERAKKRPKAIDLFCGCGGFSLGMLEGGFEVVAAADNAPDAVITYLYNLGAYPLQFHWVEPGDEERMAKALDPDRKKQGIRSFHVSGGNRPAKYPGVSHFFFGDIAKLKGKDILAAIGMKRGELDCVCGSPPCQGFTVANRKRSPDDPRNSLMFEFARLVVELCPKTMVLENVPNILQMVTPEGVPVVDKFCRILEDGGFSGVDALHRTLRAQAGAVGFLRGKVRKRTKKRSRPRREPKSKQKELFR
jgi:DNA (cytosine-5)-methyltransferase 1